MRPTISTIVLNYRTPFDTVKCVHALLDQTVADQLEILIVDNHSEDESIGTVRARFKNHPKIRFIESSGNCGYGRGNNLASRHAQGEFLLIMNPDNTLPADALEKMLSFIHTHPDCGIVGPALVYPDGSVRPSARHFPGIRDLLSKRLHPHEWHAKYRASMPLDAGAIEVDWLVGACLLIPKKVFDELKGFDERFFLFFEDIDICRRVKMKGKKIFYLPSIHVLDRKQRLSEGGLLSPIFKKTTRIHVVSAVKYFYKWSGKMIG